MFHSDLRQEIQFLHAQLDYKRRKFGELIREENSFVHSKRLFQEIRTIENKLQLCFEESRTQKEG
jgi:hypothetical protein